MEDFTVAVSELPSAVVVKITGEMRIRCEPLEIEMRSVMARYPKVVIFDLSEMSYTSSLGMGQLVNCHRSAKQRGGVVRLAAVQPMVLDSFRRARLLEIMRDYPTIEAAAKVS
jgi:anti-sigma B factor antagonist